VISIFSPQRCMFATNFPVDHLQEYGAWNDKTLIKAFKDVADRYSVEDQAWLWRKTAMKAYRVSLSQIVSITPGEVSEALVCHVTCPGDTVATSIAEELVTLELCACVNIVPGVRSIYKN
jgi:hypothetical protein